MLYERLHRIYLDSGCSEAFSTTLLGNLEEYIIDQVEQSKRLMSPYKFAYRNGLTVRKALQFFNYFTLSNGLFQYKFFLECPVYACHNRIYFDHDELSDMNNYIICSECESEYRIGDIVDFVKVYYELKTDDPMTFESIKQTARSHGVDPNSTWDAFQGMPDNLKGGSPSSGNNDEGDSFSIETIIDANQRPDGKPINETLALISMISHFIHR